MYAQYTEKEPVSAEFTVDSTGKLIGVTDIGAELIIPEYVNGTKVTSIANYLFKGNTVLQSVEIPDTVTLLGIECFRDCTALSEVKLSTSLTSIAPGAFDGCKALKEIDIPDSVRELRSDAFSGSGLESVDIWYDHGLYVGNWLIDFDDSAVTSFAIREGTVGIANGQLFSYSSKVTSVTLPSSLRHIGASCFSGAGFASVTLPAGLVSIGEQAFGNCSSLVSVNLGDCRSLESIGYSAFRSCALTEAVSPVSVTYVGGYAFNFNTGIVIKCEAASQPDGWASD